MRLSRLLPPAALALAGLAACADAPTALSAAPGAAPALGKTSSSSPNSYTVSQTTRGDTVVTTFVVGTNALSAATFNLGYGSKIDFPYSAGSICDLATSSYGPAEWNRACEASKVSVQITAKNWYGPDGLPRTDFQPAMRFVPGLRMPVALYLRDRDQQYAAGQQALYCFAAGCVDESVADPSLATTYDATNGLWKRPVKHFSGYTMSVGRTQDGEY